jgi:DNA-binding transcriptional regulator YhcF (GntR family)/predicted GIY-YIG superfamily endonuclease
MGFSARHRHRAACRTRALTRQRFALYRLFDAADRLLYVGISANPEGRFAQHAASRSWWPDVARTTITWLADRTEAERAEANAIAAENPLRNMSKQYVRIPSAEPFGPDDGPPVLRITADIRAAIYGGTWATGQRLPASVAIARDYAVSAATVSRALRMLRDEGLVSLEQGRGTFAQPLTAYRVTVTVLWTFARDTAERVAREIASRNAQAAAAEPAVTGLALDPVSFDDWAWTWRMTVRAARPGLAAAIGESVARSAAGGELGDFARATVHAEPVLA